MKPIFSPCGPSTDGLSSHMPLRIQASVRKARAVRCASLDLDNRPRARVHMCMRLPGGDVFDGDCILYHLKGSTSARVVFKPAWLRNPGLI